MKRIELTEILNRNAKADAELTLPFEKRERSRFRAELDNGCEVGVYLERGSLLRDGDRLGSTEGYVVAVKAALEAVSTVHSDDAQQLARIAYHLGNRHVKLQVGRNWVRYLHDHVLDDMVKLMGLDVRIEQEMFEPEAGAYLGHQHAHH